MLSLRRLYARAALHGDAKAQHVAALNRIFAAFATSQVELELLTTYYLLLTTYYLLLTTYYLPAR